MVGSVEKLVMPQMDVEAARMCPHAVDHWTAINHKELKNWKKSQKIKKLNYCLQNINFMLAVEINDFYNKEI